LKRGPLPSLSGRNEGFFPNAVATPPANLSSIKERTRNDFRHSFSRHRESKARNPQDFEMDFLIVPPTHPVNTSRGETPMPTQQTRDILRHVAEFHEQLSNFYSQLENQTGKERVKMLLDYLSRHETHLAESIRAYGEDASRKVLNTWFRDPQEADAAQAIKRLQISPDLSIDEVVEMGLKLDNRLITAYRQMADTAESEDVRNVFQNLLALEEQEKHRLAKNSLRVMDF
jgi:rubrerythrin